MDASTPRCSAILNDPESLNASATLQVVKRDESVIRQAAIVYSVSPRIPNAARVLANGLRYHALAWKERAATCA